MTTFYRRYPGTVRSSAPQLTVQGGMLRPVSAANQPRGPLLFGKIKDPASPPSPPAESPESNPGNEVGHAPPGSPLSPPAGPGDGTSPPPGPGTSPPTTEGDDDVTISDITGGTDTSLPGGGNLPYGSYRGFNPE